MTKKGPTRAQLQARIQRLEAELRRYRAGDTVRALGEHWYELTEYFDAEQIRRIPSPWSEPTYLMGMLSDVFIVEVPQSALPEDVDKFLALLAKNHVAPALAIRKGVRFVKLVTVDEEQEERLDAVKLRVMQMQAVKEDNHGEDAGEVPPLRAAEGLEADPEVPAVPGADDRGAEAGESDPLRDAPRE